MERCSTFLGRKNQYYESDYTAKCNLQIQCDPYQITYGIFHKVEQKISHFIWKHKRPTQTKQSWERRMELEESSFLTSDYPTKLQSSRQCGTGTKTEILPMKQDRKPTNKPMGTLFCTKEARIYNRAKTASSINGAGKTGQLHIKEWN